MPQKVQGSYPGATVTVYITRPPAVAISAISRASNIVTVTVPTGSGFIAGESVTIAGVAISTFNGTFTILTALTSSFTYSQTGANTSSSGGTASSNLRLATIYADNSLTPKANPFVSAQDGLWFFYASNGRYDIKFSGGGLPQPFTLGDYELFDEVESDEPWTDVTKSPYFAVGDGIADDTNAIQAALDSGSKSIFIPTGRFKFTTLTFPMTEGLHFFGTGTGSQLIQTGNGIKMTANSIGMFVSGALISDLYFDGTLGTGHTIDTQYFSAMDLRSLYFVNVPPGFSSIHVEGNPFASNPDFRYTHDIRIINLRIYQDSNNPTAGFAGVHFGAFTSDSEIYEFIMEGRFTVQYNIYFQGGSATCLMANSHIYNVTKNSLYMEAGFGQGGDFTFVNCTFEFSLEDIALLKGVTKSRFLGCKFSAIGAGMCGALLDNCYELVFIGTNFSELPGNSPLALSAIREINGSHFTHIIDATFADTTQYQELFHLDPDSWVKGVVPSYAPFGEIYNLVGTGDASQAQNTTRFYGAHGPTADLAHAIWGIPIDGDCLFAWCVVDTSPAAGETFLFKLWHDILPGQLIATGTIHHGEFAVKLQPSSPVRMFGPGDPLWIEAIFSTNSGSSTLRYSVTLRG